MKVVHVDKFINSFFTRLKKIIVKKKKENVAIKIPTKHEFPRGKLEFKNENAEHLDLVY